MAAGAATAYHLHPGFDGFQRGSAPAPDGVVQYVGQRGQPPEAGAALAGRLVRHPPGHLRDLAGRTGVVRQGQHGSRPQHRVEGREGPPGQIGDAGGPRIQPLAVVAAHQDTLARIEAAQLQDVGQRGPEGRLDDRGTSDGQHHGAGLGRQADRAVFQRAEACRHGELGVGLGVREQGGHAAQAPLTGPDLLSGRQSRPAVQAVDHGGALSGHEPFGQSLHPHLPACGAAFRDGRAQRLLHVGPGDADDDVVGADRGGGQQGSVEHQVRDVQQQRLVLEAAGLALTGVDDDRGPRVAALGRAHDGAQLPGEGETGPTATAQVDVLGEVDEFVRPVARHLAVRGQMRHTVEPGGLVETGQESGSAHTAEAGALEAAHSRHSRVANWSPSIAVVAPSPRPASM